MKKYCLVINPLCRSGRSKKTIDKILDSFTRHGADFTAKFSERKLHIIDLAKNARESGFDTVVAVGGDGTICEVVTGLFRADSALPMPKLGIIHAGTSPDFNKHHNIPIDTEKAIDLILSERSRPIDVVKASFYADPARTTLSNAFFVSNTNIGIGTLIVGRTNSRYRKYLGDFLGTLTALIVSLIGFKPQKISFIADNASIECGKLINLTLGKDPYIGSGMRVFNDIAPDDGKFYVMAAEKTSWREFFLNLPKIYMGNFLTYRGIKFSFASKARVEGCAQYPMLECDGDIKGYLPADFTVLRKALEVLM